MKFPPSSRTTLIALTLATAATLPLACSEVDESAPSHPRTEPLLIPNAQAEQNAAKRAEEAPSPMLPGAAGEIQRSPSPFPSPSSKAPTPSLSSPQTHVLTLADTSGPSTPPHNPSQATDKSGKKLTYNPANYYPGPLPHLPANPGTVPMTGSTPIPDDPDWSIDHSWGQGIQLAESPHREWPTRSVEYKSAEIHNNPTYYFDITPILGLQSDNSYLGDAGIAAIEIPWWFLNTAIIPVEMFIQTPWSQQSSLRIGHDPIFSGYLPQAGEIIPSPSPTAGIPIDPGTQPADGGAMTTPMTMPLTMPATTPATGSGR